MGDVTPESVIALTSATSDFLCPLSANIYGIDFLYFRIRDMDTGVVLVEVQKEEDEEDAAEAEMEADAATRTIKYHFGPDFLNLRTIGTTLEFSVGDQPVSNFRMIERHYFRDTLLKSFDFNLEFCIPGSRNQWEVIYEVPELEEGQRQAMIDNPWETRSDSFYFVEGKLIMHNKAEYSYAPFE